MQTGLTWTALSPKEKGKSPGKEGSCSDGFCTGTPTSESRHLKDIHSLYLLYLVWNGHSLQIEWLLLDPYQTMLRCSQLTNCTANFSMEVVRRIILKLTLQISHGCVLCVSETDGGWVGVSERMSWKVCEWESVWQREGDVAVGIMCVKIYDDLALEAWTQREREREREL